MKGKLRNHRKAFAAAGLMALLIALTGCGAQEPAVTPTPQAAQKETAQPTASPGAAATATPTHSPEPTQAAQEETLALKAAGQALTLPAVSEAGTLLLPLEETAKALGWNVTSEESEEEAQVKKTVQLRQGDSQITIVWTVSDNTARQITWQKDGLLVPVDPMITTLEDQTYVPAAFFETAMDVRVSRDAGGVTVQKAQESASPSDAS